MCSCGGLRTAVRVWALLILIPVRAVTKDPGLVARWSFNEQKCGLTRESVSGVDDRVEGFCKYVSGVSGNGLRFDGYTTSVVHRADSTPKLSEAFTIEAWVALDTYPWNWAPVVDQQDTQQAGYFFGIDAYGHVGLQLSVSGVWQSVTSEAVLPLKKWAFIAGAYDATNGLAIYLNRKPVCRLSVQGKLLSAGKQDILIGRVRQPELPGPPSTIHPRNSVWYSLDGILDEIEIYNRSLSPAEIEKAYAAVEVPAEDVLPWPELPSGPPGPGRFGAYYATLKYEDTWDAPRRIGLDSDVVVRFDESSNRLVFWQGLNYNPAWVTENGKWYTDEFLETWGSGCTDGRDCEPMSDKQSRYSHLRILESNPARVVVHWRYALSEVEFYKGAWPDPYTGWFDWADEYWIIYPDGVAIRKQVLWSSALDKQHEWQESIVVNPAGTRPEDNISTDAITVGNMKGEAATYAWVPRPPKSLPGPKCLNIQIVNLKSQWKPFQIVSPAGSTIVPHTGPGFPTQYSAFHWRNHWPLTQIATSGRSAVAPDRPSSTSLSNIYWEPYAKGEDSMTKIMLAGLTTKSVPELVPLARSWLLPPKLDVKSDGYRNEGYDPTRGSYLMARQKSLGPKTCEVVLQASQESPAVHPGIVIRDWGEKARLGAQDIYGKLFKDTAKINWHSKQTLDQARTFSYDDACIRCHANLFSVGLSRKGVDGNLLAAPKIRRFEYSLPRMGTVFRIEMYAVSSAQASEAAEAAFARAEELEQIMSDYRADSELMRLSREGSSAPFPVSSELYEVLAKSQWTSELSGGVFDISIGPLVDLWRGARKTGRLPDATAIARARSLVDYHSIELDPARHTVYLKRPGMKLDLGAIGKGYAADRMLAVLQSRGIKHAMVVAGGEVVASEPPPGSTGWKVAIDTADAEAGRPACTLLLHAAAVSTSGDEHQFLELNCHRYSHVINPRTGWALEGQRSTTVIALDSTTADALATAFSLMPQADAIRAAESQPGVSAMWVRREDGAWRRFVSHGFPASCRATTAH